MRGRTTRAALYARVSTADQEPQNQLAALRAYATARAWITLEYVDRGVSGAKERRPALDRLLADCRRRKVDAVVVVRLDRLARSVHHLVSLGRELEALGVELVVTEQALDTSTPAGRLLFTVLGAIAEFERDLIRERVIAGVRRARAQGVHVRRPQKHDLDPEEVAALRRQGLSLGEIGRRLGNGQPIHHTVIRRALAQTLVSLAVDCEHSGAVS
jgi:DNA invertase Pin-like site-specific DNA recombinase